LIERQLYPYIDIDIDVPKSSDGTLRLNIRHDDEGDLHGLFVHGFKSSSAAEEEYHKMTREAVLQETVSGDPRLDAIRAITVGDELLEVDHKHVQGQFLSVLVAILQSHQSSSVHMKIRRHTLPGGQIEVEAGLV
jgi:hypothetical protein